MKPNEMVAVQLPMTAERKKRMGDLAKKIADLAVEGTEGPPEALAVLQMVINAICSAQGITFGGTYTIKGPEPSGEPH